MIVKAILASDLSWAIGKSDSETGLPWNQIKEDFKHFQFETKQVDWLVMGNETFKIIRKLCGEKLLPGRNIIVLSRKLTESPHPEVKLCKSVDEVFELVGDDSLMVGGGKQTYEAFLPRLDEIILTQVHSSFVADCYLGRELLKDFTEDRSKTKVLRPLSDSGPEVTAHYFIKT